MAKEKRETARNAGQLEVMLVLRNCQNEERLASPVAGRLSDVSQAGASLTVDHIRSDGFHLFYAAKDSSTRCLCLESEEFYAGASHFSIPVNPVWYNCEGTEGAQRFKMGVEFKAKPNSEQVRLLVKQACVQQGAGSGWFGRNLCSLVNGLKGWLGMRG